MALITVVTVAKDAAAFLPETLESIQAQTLTDWRHVVVDDGSSDDTAAIVAAAAERDPRVVLVRRDESVGPYAAANPVMFDADSRYIARIDADDVAFPRRLEEQVGALEASGARACSGAWQPLLSDGSTTPVRRLPSTSCTVLKWMLWLVNPFVHSTMLIETECFAAMGGYGPERVSEDHRLWCRLARAGLIAVVDSATVQYRFSSTQLTATGDILTDPVRVRIHLEHLRACGFADATLDDAADLRHIGRDSAFPASRALALLARWRRAWQQDAALTEAERVELRDYTVMREVSHLRLAFRSKPWATAGAAAAHLPFVAPQIVGALRRGGGKSWR